MFRRNEEERHDQPINPREVRHEGGTAGAPRGSSGEVTVVGTGCRLEGSIVSAGSLQVDGEVKGRITADGDVILTAQSRVEADIHARNVSVAGAFTGNLVVEGRTELVSGGRVDGNVTSKILVVQEGAVFTGQSIMDSARAGPGAPAPAAAAPRRGSIGPAGMQASDEPETPTGEPAGAKAASPTG